MWHQGAKLFVRTYKLWQLCQARVVVVHCLHQFLAALLVSCCSFVCGTDHILQLSTMSWKSIRKTRTFLFFCFCIYDDSFQPVPFTNSKLVDSRLPTQEGKQTSHTSASTSEWPRSNQAVVIFFFFSGRIPSSRIPNTVLLSIRLVHNTAVGTRGWISPT